MKKLIFISAILAIGFMSCNTTSNGSDNNDTTNVSQEAVENSTEQPTEEVAVVTEPSGYAFDTSVVLSKPMMLNMQTFRQRVFDMQATPDKWVYKGDKPAIVDFYADWCGPCKIAAPILDELAKEYEGQVYIYKVDTEADRALSQYFRISSIPAFLIIPSEGDPRFQSGIARTPEATKELFKQIIDQELLKK